MIRKEAFLSSICFLIFTICLSIIVANRDITLVEDNYYYIDNFLYKTSFDNFHYEFFFDLTTFIIRFFTDSYIIYFLLLNVILNSILYITSLKVSQFYNLKINVYVLIFFSFVIVSSWYYTLATNGLRQGLSLAMCYLSMVYLLLYRKKFIFLIFFIISCFLHYSTILLLPFITLFKMNVRKLFLISSTLGVGYAFGLNESIVRFVSDTLNIPLYQYIANYVEGADSYRYGFQLDLFVYTFGLSIFYFLFDGYMLNHKSKISEMIKIYLILVMPYYVFGFAAFSNRYGIISWFFTIFINSLIFYLILKRRGHLFAISFVFLWFFSVVYFFYNFTGFI